MCVCVCVCVCISNVCMCIHWRGQTIFALELVREREKRETEQPVVYHTCPQIKGVIRNICHLVPSKS